MREPGSKVVEEFGGGAREMVNDSYLKVNRLEEAHSVYFKCGECRGWFWGYEVIGNRRTPTPSPW